MKRKKEKGIGKTDERRRMMEQRAIRKHGNRDVKREVRRMLARISWSVVRLQHRKVQEGISMCSGTYRSRWSVCVLYAYLWPKQTSVLRLLHTYTLNTLTHFAHHAFCL